MDIDIPSGSLTLEGDLEIPSNPKGIIIFVHGSGSSRHSPRNKSVAAHLNKQGFATLLFDLLTADEEIERSKVFDINLLTRRLLDATKWVKANKAIARIPVGYFGASTGAAAALVAASLLGTDISAVVSRGGRVDMAGGALERVHAPTLMIVGQRDEVVLDLNNQAQRDLACESELVTIAEATHLFEEPGALEKVAHLATEWFLRYLKT